MKGLTQTQIEQFNEQGYLVVDSVIGESELSAIEAEYAATLERETSELFEAGRVTSHYAGLPFGDRYTAVLAEEPALFERIDISLPLHNHDFPVDAKVHTGPAVFDLLTHPQLLDIVESLIGPEIESNPVQHVRIKPPRRSVPAALAGLSYVGKTTWHQDMGALLDEANDTEVVTAWVAVTDANKDNGCLCAIPGSHKKRLLTMHCPGRGIAAENYIPAQLLGAGAGCEDPDILPVGRGGVVLFNRFTQHSALPNKTGSIRWSFDLRYHPTGQPSGRPAFPSFVARSRIAPQSVTSTCDQWTNMWRQAHQKILSGNCEGPIFNAERWSRYADSPLCG